MARAKTKEELVVASNQNYEKLMKILLAIPEEEIEAELVFDLEKEKGAHWVRDKNVRDILIHLYEWHCLLLEWVASNQAGMVRDFLLEGYNWRTYGQMNQMFWEKHQATTFEEAFRLFETSHTEVMALLKGFSDEELFTKNVFSWVGGSTLGSYFVSATASHYDWALKKIRKHQKISKINDCSA